MSEYTHRMTVIVPELMTPQANQLALIAGESPDDDNTFTQANWQDVDGNLYAVCSTVIKPIVLSLFGKPVVDSVLDADGVDKSLAQQALDSAIIYGQDMAASKDKIIIAIDIDPLTTIAAMGLSQVVDADSIGGAI